MLCLLCLLVSLGYLLDYYLTLSATMFVLQVTPSDYKGSICLDIAGHHINGVGIALIVVAILIVIVLLSLVCYCCCCRW